MPFLPPKQQRQSTEGKTVTATELFILRPILGGKGHITKQLSLFPGVHRHTGTEIFFSRQLTVVVDCSSFSSVCSLFCAHGATTMKAVLTLTR